MGAGTANRFTMTAGGRTREYQVAEPEPGRVLTKSRPGRHPPQRRLADADLPPGGAGGIGGLFERLSHPRVLRAIHTDELKRLDAHAPETPLRLS